MDGGFDDIEMRNRNIEEEEEEREEETNLLDPNISINIINKENPRFNRVADIPDVRKDAGSMKKSMTEDRKKSFKKIYDITLEKKNGPDSSILIDNTEFVKDQKGKVSIFFKGK